MKDLDLSIRVQGRSVRAKSFFASKEISYRVEGSRAIDTLVDPNNRFNVGGGSC